MPSAKPIIVIMLRMKNDRSNALPTTAVAPTAAMIDTSATKSGRPAATSAPNTITRITMATPMPIISPSHEALFGREVVEGGLRARLAVCVDRETWTIDGADGVVDAGAEIVIGVVERERGGQQRAVAVLRHGNGCSSVGTSTASTPSIATASCGSRAMASWKLASANS